MTDRTTITERQMLAVLRRGLRLLPLSVRAKAGGSPGVGTLVEIAWGKRRYRFVALLKARSTPRAFEEAVRRASAPGFRRPKGRRALVVLPYLSDAQLEWLARRRLSGVDLSGNGIVLVPGEVYVCRSGRANQYRESVPTKYAYRGTTSLVPRVFLCRAEYERVSEIQSEIQARGGNVALSTVSKALKRMEEDVLIGRRAGVIRLLQADALLDKLRESYRPPRTPIRRELSTDRPLETLFAALPKTAAAVLTGTSSAQRYAVMGRDDHAVVYCRDVDKVLGAWRHCVGDAERFADLELRQTEDAGVYFDARVEGAVRYASPVQAYLELASGDKRDRQAALRVRDLILKELSRWTRS